MLIQETKTVRECVDSGCTSAGEICVCDAKHAGQHGCGRRVEAASVFVFFVFFCFVLSGCETHGPDGSMRRHYFGYTVVTIPKSAPVRPDFYVREVSNFGLAAGGGAVGLGFNRTKDVSLPPDGAIYLEVATDAQFEQARKLIETYEGICITQKRTTKTNLCANP